MPALDLPVRASVSSAHYVERLGQHSTAGCHASGHILMPSKAILATASARASLPEDVRSSQTMPMIMSDVCALTLLADLRDAARAAASGTQLSREAGHHRGQPWW